MSFNAEYSHPNFDENTKATQLPPDGYGVEVGDRILYTGPSLYTKSLVPNKHYRIDEIDTTRNDPYLIEDTHGDARWVGAWSYYMLVKSGANIAGASDSSVTTPSTTSREAINEARSIQEGFNSIDELREDLDGKSTGMGLPRVQFKDIKPKTTMLTWTGESNDYFTKGYMYRVTLIDSSSGDFEVECKGGPNSTTWVFHYSSDAQNFGVVYSDSPLIKFNDLKIQKTLLTWTGESDSYFTKGHQYYVEWVDYHTRTFDVEIDGCGNDPISVDVNSSDARSLGVVDDGEVDDGYLPMHEPTPITVTIVVHGETIELTSEHSIKLSDGGAKQLFDELVATITK